MELRCHSCEWNDQCHRDEKDGQTLFGKCDEVKSASEQDVREWLSHRLDKLPEVRPTAYRLRLLAQEDDAG